MISGSVQSSAPVDWADCHVSNGEHILPLSAGGRYQLPWTAGRHRFVFVIPPDGYRPVGRWWRDASAVGRQKGPTFAIEPTARPLGKPLAILHVTDFHVAEPRRGEQPDPHGPPAWGADYPSAKRLAGVLTDLLHAAGGIDFIIATGDLTNAGDEPSLRAVARVLSALPVRVYPVFGGHDGNVERAAGGVPDRYYCEHWTRHLAPPYYAWHAGGRHFLSFFSETTNYLDPTARAMHDAFVAEDLRLFGERMPVTVCSHKHPYPWNEPIFHRYRVDSWLHGHFHCNRVIDHQQIRVFSTSTPAFGAMDIDVAAARRITFAPVRGPIIRPSLPRRADVLAPHRLQIAWSTAGRTFSHLAAPTVQGERLYCGVVDEAAGEQGGVSCLDARTGHEIWTAAVAGSVVAPLGRRGDRIVAATQTGRIVCLSTEGRELWHQVLPESYDRWLYAAPVIDGDKVIVGTTSCLTCLSLADGAIRWTYRSPKKSSDAFGQFQHAAVRDGKVFLAGYRTGSVLLDAASGALLHQNDDLAHRYTSRVDTGSGYVIGDGVGHLSSFDPVTGQLHWRVRLSQNMVGSAFVPFAGGLLGGTADGLVLVSPADGSVIARRSFGLDLHRFTAYRNVTRSCHATPAVVGQTAWVASGDGYLTLLSGPRLRLIDRIRVPQPIIAPPSIVHEHQVTAVTLDGTLTCFTAEPRSPRRRPPRPAANQGAS